MRPLLLMTLLAVVLISASCSDENVGPVAVQPLTTLDSTWTYIVYDAADGSAVNIYDNYLVGSNMRSGRYVNLIGLHDDEDSPAIYWRIDEHQEIETIESIGEINTGDEETLYDLVRYAKANYPAGRYIVTLYGHGGAFYGCCPDATPEPNTLRLHELRGALEKTGGVDMVLFTAPCIMGCIEMAYELRSCTNIVMGSEGVSSFAFWQFSLNDAFSVLHTNPVTTPREISELIIEQIPEYMPTYQIWGADSFMTMAAVRTDKVQPLAGALDELARAYLQHPDAFEAMIDSHREEFATYPCYFPEDEPYLVDIGNLARQLLLIEADANMRSKLRSVQERLAEAVVAECHHESHGDVSGLTVFLPPSDYERLSYYQGQEDLTLQFAEDTKWDELMSVLIESPPAESTSTWTGPWQGNQKPGILSGDE
jgi:hypothetical protein